jgi:hypothetical protein
MQRQHQHQQQLIEAEAMAANNHQDEDADDNDTLTDSETSDVSEDELPPVASALQTHFYCKPTQKTFKIIQSWFKNRRFTLYEVAVDQHSLVKIEAFMNDNENMIVLLSCWSPSLTMLTCDMYIDVVIKCLSSMGSGNMDVARTATAKHNRAMFFINIPAPNVTLLADLDMNLDGFIDRMKFWFYERLDSAKAVFKGQEWNPAAEKHIFLLEATRSLPCKN